MPKTNITITIIGIGESMHGDESAGVEAVRLWQKTYPETAMDPHLMVKQPGTPGLELIDLLADADFVLLVDAVQSGAAPGTLHLVTPEQISSSNKGAGSAHGWGAAEMLAIARELHYPMPDHIMILGIEAANFQVGAPLSKPVAGALAQAAEMIEDRIHWWLVL
jgi:hydrogenase maturation protease